MGQTLRVSLPGYDAKTDTNLDHYSLYSDIDNVLIKRLLTGSTTVAEPTGSQTILTIPHNLGYIPFFIAYCDNYNNGQWEIINNQYNPFSVPQQISAADTTNLYIYNFGGHGFPLPVAYDIFYDAMSSGTPPPIQESNEVVKVTRPGYDALSETNPNNYIMHSDLNNFKILKEGSLTATITPGGTFSPYSFAHGANVQTPVKYFCFVKFPDGYTFLVGSAAHYDWSKDYYVESYADTSKIYLGIGGGSANVTVSIKYYIYGTGKSGTIPLSGQVMAVAKKGINALTETNPENFNFHSSYNTLKYYTSGQDLISVSSTTTHTIPHNLGYVPFFIAFVKDLAGIISNGYCIIPYYWGRTAYPQPNTDIAAFAFADKTNLYLQLWFRGTGTGVNATFYYKIFKNNLGL